MKLFRALALSAFVAAPVQAQVVPVHPYGAAAFDQHRYQADQHRYEMDRLRLQSDQRDIAARQNGLETRLNRLRIEAARAPQPAAPQPTRTLRSPEEERALRLSATERRQAQTAGSGQIDAWLDRASR